MNTDPNPAKAIFLEAVERHAPDGWPAFVDGACAGNPNLRGQVEALLAAHREVGTVQLRELAEGADSAPAATVDKQPMREQPSAVIGPYKLLEQIGEGGFGVVFLAEQTEPVRRKVALKVLKPGMDTRQVVARFEAERQALAIMDHPNIAKVFDAGPTASGRPYFVMELVRGVPITEFCDENQLTPRERLGLFSQACSAVQHAHQKGVIHRDLKPSNVLVSRHDTTPVVKVIDFGVAKALGQELTDKTLFTGIAQMVGTPLYMSPEQAGMSDLDVDTRSDIYSLGVLLYELLTGTTPFTKERFQQAAYDEIRRIIREEEPPKPSTRLSEIGRSSSSSRPSALSGPTPQAEPTERESSLASIAAHRKTEPLILGRLIKGDLDWIVMKCLEKDRNRRYQTANGLATDLQRHLADEPVVACPPSFGYRLRKFMRRNRGLVLSASMVALVLVAGMAGTTWGMIRARHERRNALAAQRAEVARAEGERRAKEETQKRLEQIEKGTSILASVFRDLDPIAAESEGEPLRVLLGRRLDEAVRQLDGEAVGDPLVVARLQHVLGVSLRELGHLEQAERVLVKAGQTRERLLGANHLDTVATKHHLAMLYQARANYTPAEALYREVLAARTATLGADHPDTLSSRHDLATLSHTQRRFTPAEALYEAVLAARTAKLGADHPDTLTSRHRLAALYRCQGKLSLAEALFKEVLAARMAKLGANHLDTIATKHNLALLYVDKEEYAPAEALYKEVLVVRAAKLGADHPDTLTSRHHLAALCFWQRKYDLAESLLKEVLAARTARLGADHPSTLGTQVELGWLYQSHGKYAQAEALYQDVLDTGAAKLGADDRVILQTEYYLAALYHDQGKYVPAKALYQEILATKTAKLGANHPETLGVQADLGANHCAAGQFAEGIPLLVEVHRKGGAQPHLTWVGKALLTAYVRAGKTTEARALVAEQVRAARERFSSADPRLNAELSAAGRALIDAQAYVAAEPLLRESLSLAERQVPDAWTTHHVKSLLGGALLGQRNYSDAEPFLIQGYAGLKECAAKIPPEEQSYLTTAQERLVELYDAWGKPDDAVRWRKELEKAKE